MASTNIPGFLTCNEFLAVNPSLLNAVAAQNGITLTSPTSIFTTALIGGIVLFSDNTTCFILGYTNDFNLIVTPSQTKPRQNINIFYGKTQMDQNGISAAVISVTTLNVVSLSATNLTIFNNATIGNNLTVAATLKSLSLNNTGNATIGGNLNTIGALTAGSISTSTFNVSGALTAGSISSPSITGASITGASISGGTIAAGSLTASGAISANSLNTANAITASGTISGATLQAGNGGISTTGALTANSIISQNAITAASGFNTTTGNFTSTSGGFSTTNGNFTTVNGNFTTTNGTIATNTLNVTGPFTASGAINLPGLLNTKGGLISFNGTASVQITPPTGNNQILFTNSASPNGLTYTQTRVSGTSHTTYWTGGTLSVVANICAGNVLARFESTGTFTQTTAPGSFFGGTGSYGAFSASIAPVSGVTEETLIMLVYNGTASIFRFCIYNLGNGVCNWEACPYTYTGTLPTNPFSNLNDTIVMPSPFTMQWNLT